MSSDRTEFVQHGIVPCKECGKPHDAFRRPDSKEWGSWASRDDGHPYRQMSAEEVVVRFLMHGSTERLT